MDIRINGNPADITLETEQTLGEILSGIEDWLGPSGYALSGLRINGAPVGAASIAEAFSRNLRDIESLEVETSNWQDLTLEALLSVRQRLEAYQEASFEEKRPIREDWEESAAASFLSGNDPDLFQCILKTLKGEGLSPEQLRGIIGERIRELSDPLAELHTIDPLIEGIAKRLEDLPLDIQTGKDSRAAETVQLFSTITEKLFRLFSLLQFRSLVTESGTIDGLSFHDFIEEFSAALRELLAAYEVKDAVLVGDLAEYELAPRLRSFYAAINTPVTTVT
ncbi:MAG: hypothetical protein LBP93_00340 [Treponema sp.]|jgi:hypothetical protein|nr:hypothetical protein [Treponema sp.]